MLKRKDLQKLAALRLKEARILLEHRCWEGAYYLAGYAVECALKACLAKRTERHEFPDREFVNASYTHKPEELLRLAELRDSLREGARLTPALMTNWEIVREWSERSRYQRPTQSDAEELWSAVIDRKQGVFRWLKRHW